MGTILNPTGGAIRNDAGGSGYFGAPRGSETHGGVDFSLPEGPGQPVLAPVGGRIVRVAYPYSGNTQVMGAEIRNGDLTLQMFYFRPHPALVGQNVAMGQVIGTAQDVARLMGQGYEKVTPHVHLEIETVNPLLLM